jgi:hypothetical protein
LKLLVQPDQSADASDKQASITSANHRNIPTLQLVEPPMATEEA